MSTFPYLLDEDPPRTARPIVDVRVHLDGRAVTCRALLDTGSTLTVFDRGVADALGVTFGRKGAEQAQLRLLGSHGAVQFEHAGLELYGTDESWDARVGFLTYHIDGLPVAGLLGSAGFFDRYVVRFAEYHGWVEVEHAAHVPPV